MFCQKCGTQLPDNSNFCTTCGHAFNASHQSQINYSDVASSAGDFLKSLFLSPIECCSEYSKSLSSTFAYLYFAIATLLFSILTTITSKFAIKSTILSAMKSESTDYLSSELMEASFYINSFLDTFLPFFKTFCSIALAFVLFFGSIALISYIIHNLAFKVSVPLNEYIVVASVALTLQGVALIISMLLLAVIPVIGCLILSISSILIAVVLYTGLSNLKEEHSSDPYVFSFLYTIITFLTTYVTIKIIASSIFSLYTEFMGGSFSDIFSFLDFF